MNITERHPHVWDYWNDERNPEEIAARSKTKIHLKCKKGHTWTTTAANYSASSGHCVYCNNSRVCIDNCLATVRPDLLQYWSDKNIISPYDIVAGSHKKVWWQCEKGHLFQKSPAQMKNRGCKYCANKAACEDNCLATTHSELAKEWDYDKNKLTPKEVLAGSHKKVWWKCENGHNFCSVIKDRAFQNKGCKYCKNKAVCEDNCLATTHPELAKLIHPDSKVTASDITFGSVKKISWLCENGHTFRASPNMMTNLNYKCPKCATKKVANQDYNILKVVPELQQYWDYDKNDSPEKYTPLSRKKVYWKCKCGYGWKEPVHYMESRRKCPKCHIRGSFKCANWLDKLKIKTENREVYFNINNKALYLDGFQDGVVYEYLGIFWHGDPRHFNPCEKNRQSKKKYGNLLYNTICRFNLLSKEYKVIYRWEKENKDKIYKIIKKSKKEILELANKIYENKLDLDILEEL